MFYRKRIKELENEINSFKVKVKNLERKNEQITTCTVCGCLIYKRGSFRTSRIKITKYITIHSTEEIVHDYYCKIHKPKEKVND